MLRLLAMHGTLGVVSSLYDEANASTKYSIVDCNELALGSGLLKPTHFDLHHNPPVHKIRTKMMVLNQKHYKD